MIAIWHLAFGIWNIDTLRHNAWSSVRSFHVCREYELTKHRIADLLRFTDSTLYRQPRR